MLTSLHRTLTNIQTGYTGAVESVPVPISFYNAAVLDILQKAGYIGDYTIETPYYYRVAMKYFDTNTPALKKIQIMSTPGRRMYMSHRELLIKFPNNFHFVVILTSHSYNKVFFSPLIGGGSFPVTKKIGILTLREALRLRIGGEVLFTVL